MGIYIKGVNIPEPENCWKCWFMDLQTGKCWADGNVRGLVKGYKRPADCPASIVHDHGDLIDRSTMMNDLVYDVEMDERALDDTNIIGIERKNLQFDKDCKQNYIYYLMEQEIIIPAERGE